jgi:hypothetical protein
MMRFWTIWTIHHMALAERLRRTREWATLKVAHRLPRKLAYWSFIDTGTRYMTTDEVVPDVKYMDLLQRAGDDIMGDAR